MKDIVVVVDQNGNAVASVAVEKPEGQYTPGFYTAQTVATRP